MLFTAQEIVPSHTLHDALAISFLASTGEYECLAEITTVQAPSSEILMKAKIQFAKKNLFGLIQTLQQMNLEKRREIYEVIKQADQQIDQDQQMIQKIKEKAIRAELTEEVISFKRKVAEILGIMSRDTQAQMDNLLIAQLNDVAFKAIKKTGMQKKLDERAIKSQKLFQQLEQQLAQYHGTLDLGAIGAVNQQLVESIGTCPLSVCNTMELMENKDCMCIGLSISRSEACIADPTRLVIREVYPAFMSLDSFLESSIYNLKLNQNAHGGFDYKNEGSLAVGAGLQQISGVLPLYLFDEHW